jgi:DNA polymerase III subunit delta
MTPDQFLDRLQRQPLAPAYLFLGQEAYQRRRCREAIIKRALPGPSRGEGFTLIDLEQLSLPEVLDDARSLSLFSSERVICVTSIELALPRRLVSSVEEEEEAPNKPSAGTQLASYLKSPSPGTVLIFECSRYDFAGDDRAKLERVQKFFSPVAAVVEFRHFTPESSRALAQQLAREQGLKLSGPALAGLLDAVAGDASRLAAEIEKLVLFVGTERAVTTDDLRALVPNAAQSTIFALVNALGNRDRAGALRSLDILIREGEYLPLALTFLSTQFRLALAAKEARVSSVQQAQAFFAKIGVRMWRERAEQVLATETAFSKTHLETALNLIYQTDKKFRDGYREDRIVMESLILGLTENARAHG